VILKVSKSVPQADTRRPRGSKLRRNDHISSNTPSADVDEPRRTEILLPTLEPRQAHPFYHGASIAFSNLQSDASPEKLLEMITDLEENKPIVSGESKTRLDGAQWVYNALKKRIEEDSARANTEPAFKELETCVESVLAETDSLSESLWRAIKVNLEQRTSTMIWWCLKLA
jgi:hypothetical protein